MQRNPLDILTAEGGIINGWQNINEEKISVGRFLSHELLTELDDGQSSVSIEGIRIQDEIQTNAAILKLATIATTGASVLASWGIALKHKFLDKEELGKGDHLRIFASTLASLWSTSDEVSQTISSAYYGKGNDNEINKAREIATRFNASISLTHPEDVVVFMRNVFMSLKLMTLAEQDNTEGEKNKIAFRVGAAHGAISDMIKFGKDITLTLLDIYPKDILKQIVEFNTSEDKGFDERIQDFCTTIVIPVHEARMTDTGTKYLTDEKLKDYLNNRFTETS